MSTCSCVAVCNCCDGITAETPAVIVNRPGLSRIAYRAGTHQQFRDTMQARLSTLGLDLLRTRDADDFGIALLDSWATVADILTFYQERIANENYLRTATERVSLQELAKLIGYTLRPGLAAETFISFLLDEPPALPPGTPVPASIANSTPKSIVIAPGVKVQSVPGPGEQPATFETLEKIEARSQWNAMRVLTKGLYGTATRVWLQGAQNALQTGDTLLFEAAGAAQITRITRVQVDSDRNLTAVDLEKPVAVDPGINALFPGLPVKNPPPLSVNTARTLTQGYNWNQADLVAMALQQNWDLDEVAKAIDQAAAQTGPVMSAHLMRIHAQIFAHNGPAWAALPATQRHAQILWEASNATTSSPILVPAAYPTDWDASPYLWQETTFNATHKLDLDNVYSALVPGKWLAMQDLTLAPFGVKITSAEEVSLNRFAVTGRATRLGLSAISSVQWLKRREAKILGQTDTFQVAPRPVIGGTAGGSTLFLERASLHLQTGQYLEISGQPIDQASPVKEVRTIAGLWLQNGLTRIDLDQPLTCTYLAETLRINANVALASHGESKQEIAGSGDGTQLFQKFTLKQLPLTWLPDAVPSGASSTLGIQVNGVTWHEKKTLYGAAAQDRIFITRQDEKGNTVVEFGDGVTGSRLPSGQDNVQAKYRQGLGAAGNVRAGQLSQLLTRQLGVKDASNPLPATGGEDPETLEQSRSNAPFTVRTLDRVVSLRDYEDFARATAGISKSLATLSWDRDQRAILVTLAGPDENSKVFKSLLTSIQAAGDPHVPVVLKPYRPVQFSISGTVTTDPDRNPDTVLSAVRAALTAAYSFNARAFAQPVFLSEVIAVIQNVTGVIAVDLDTFYRNGTPPLTPPPEVLIADGPALSGPSSLGAELLTLDPQSLKAIGAATS